MAKRLLIFLALGIVLLIVGCWWVTSRGSQDEGEDYTTIPVQHGRAADVITATGPVQPRDLYTVGTDFAGKVVEVRADFNQEVEEGELLARLDDQLLNERLRQAELAVQEARAGVQQAQAAFDAAATALQREQERSPDVRRQIDVDVARRQFQSAEAATALAQVKVQEAEEARRNAENDLRKTEVRAPILADNAAASAGAPADRAGLGELAPAGTPSSHKHTFTVLDRAVSVNQMVGPPAGGRLFTLAGSLEQMQVEVQAPEADVSKIARGQSADVKGPGGDSGPAFEGHVEDVRLTPISEHGAVFYKAVVGVRNERDAKREWRLRPGMTADVDILLREHDPVWKVPAAALTFQLDSSAQTEAAKAKLARKESMKDPDQWRPVWVIGADRKPWPIFVRTGGRDGRGDTGVQTAEFSEVLEWDPDLQPPNPADPNTYPRVVIAAPPPKRSFFTLPKVKL